ncbi:MAG: hypothetical protein HY864_13350 [Chloroflexi bacterium]|nr:hypothetical protein [Chloroflexota bacterium]
MAPSLKKSGNVVIGVDIDNVLSNTDHVIRNLIEQEYGIVSRREQIIYWDYFKSLPITPEQEGVIFGLFHDHYCLQAPIIQFAQESLKLLSANYLIWLITSRPAKTNSLTKEWLNQHNIAYNNLIHSNNKIELFDTVKLLIEDNGKTAIDYVNKGVPVILFNCPWNTEHQHPMIFRVDNWHHALDTIADDQFRLKYLHQIV